MWNIFTNFAVGFGVVGLISLCIISLVIFYGIIGAILQVFFWNKFEDGVNPYLSATVTVFIMIVIGYIMYLIGILVQ